MSIVLTDLTKQFGDLLIVDHVSLEIADGELASFGATVERGMLLIQADNAGRQLAAVSAALGEHAARISDLAVERANLENVFLHLTGRSLRED